MEIPCIIFLTRASTNPLTTLIIEDCLSLPEYSQMLNKGYTYCINLRGTDAQKAIQVSI